MVSKKVIIAVAVVAIVVIVAVAAAAGGGSKDPDARYNYEVTFTDKIGSGLFPWTPSEGNQYAIVRYVVANDHYDAGISTNDLIWVWKISAGGISYSTSLAESSLPEHKIVTVEKGGKAVNALAFEVPNTLKVSDITVTQEYTWTFDPPVLELDTGLTV